MKKVNMIFALICWALTGFCQRPKNTIEIMPYIKWDIYPSITYAINSLTTNEAQIKGLSYGISAAYAKGFKRNLKLKTGIGYYRYSFTQIKNINSLYGEGNGRLIDYEYLDPVYNTNKYWYHTITLSLGAEKYYTIKDSISLLLGTSIQYYHTFSQFYKIADTYNYKQRQNRSFGFAGSLHAGIVRKFNRLSIAPQFIIPIHTIWHKDKVFPSETPGILENPSSQRNKWFKGIGFGCSIQYDL